MQPELVCPTCRDVLVHHPDALRCPGPCRRTFPVVAGIPDLRVHGDAYLSLEDDRAKARALAEVPGDFETVLRAYWASTPEVPDELARRYIATALDATRRGERQLDRLGAIDGPVLDIGCGTGGLLVAAARRATPVTGVDIALRWLVVARRRLEDEGIVAQLVAADGALLPFREATFATVCCIEVIEHAADQRGLLHWCLAAARPGGQAYAVVANRFSLAPEPTVGLWLVGYLPRRWAAGYVAWRRTTRYQHFRALSRHELRALLGAGTAALVGPAVLPAVPASAAASTRALDRVYHQLRLRPLAKRALGAITPYLEVLR